MSDTAEILNPAGAEDAAQVRFEEQAGLLERRELRPARTGWRADPRMRHGIMVLFLAAGFTCSAVPAVRWVQYRLTHETTDNAYVKGHVHPVSARIAGTVTKVLVDDNQRVAGGQTLVLLDPADSEVSVAQARAELAQARSLFHKTSLDRQRAEELRSAKVIAQQDFDKTQAQDEISAGQEQVSLSRVKGEELLLSYTRITAPSAGTVGHKSVETGQRVQVGQPLLAVVDDKVWIMANFKETQLAKLRVGQPAEITIDSLPGKKFTGRVESFSPASGAEFALLPPDNATGNFTKIVQRVPVKIVFDAASIRGFEGRIVPGISAVVSVSTQ